MRRIRKLNVELVLPSEDVPLQRIDRERAEFLRLEQLHDGAEAVRFQPVRHGVVEDQARDIGRRPPRTASRGFGQRRAVGDRCASNFLAAGPDVMIFGDPAYPSTFDAARENP